MSANSPMRESVCDHSQRNRVHSSRIYNFGVDKTPRVVYNLYCSRGRGGIGIRARLRGVWATVRVQVPSTAPTSAVVHDTMGYPLFFCRRSPYIKRFSEYGGAKVLNARIFLFYRRCTADFCFAPPYEKNQKVEGNIKRFLRIHSVFAEHCCYLGEPADSLPCRGDDRPTGNDGQTGRIRFLADDKLRQIQTTQRWKT